MAYGLRVLADDIYKQAPRLTNPFVPPRPLNVGHQHFADEQAENILNGYSLPSGPEAGKVIPPFSSHYKGIIEPIYRKIHADKSPLIQRERIRVQQLPAFSKPHIGSFQINGKILEDNPSWK
jgi:hypothetical protein